MKAFFGAALLLLVLAGSCATAQAQATPSAAPTTAVDVHALPPAFVRQPPLDPQKATAAYLARVSGAARQRSDSYFEGGYVLLFVDAFYALLVSALLLWLRISARMRDWAESITRSRFWQVPIYVAQYVTLTTIVTLPLTIYEEFFREHAYGLSNQSFLQWSGDQAIEFLILLVAASILLTLTYAVIRAARRSWWMWATVIFLAFNMAAETVYPVFIAPLFNDYTPLPESSLKKDILSLAEANGIPATYVYVYDASRQSDRISANVSGMFGTTRIALNDNLLHRATRGEILSILGHEMGHYVLNHEFVLLLEFGLVIFVGFAFVDWGFRVLTDIFGGNWDVRTIDDPAGLPAIAALATLFMLLATPVTSTVSRTAEAQADLFGLNAARQPDGEATVDLKLGEYRKLDPGPIEEFIFFDHPSGRDRIFMAMRWKAAHLNDPDIKAGPRSPQ